MEETITQRYYTARQLAEYIGSTEGSIRAKLSKGDIPRDWVIYFGGSLRFDRVAVDAYCDRQKPPQEIA